MSGYQLQDNNSDRLYVFRIKIFNGSEYHILGKHVYEAMEKFRAHPMFDERIVLVSQLAKVDS